MIYCCLFVAVDADDDDDTEFFWAIAGLFFVAYLQEAHLGYRLHALILFLFIFRKHITSFN